jgi:hypothetical protein
MEAIHNKFLSDHNFEIVRQIIAHFFKSKKLIFKKNLFYFILIQNFNL